MVGNCVKDIEIKSIKMAKNKFCHFLTYKAIWVPLKKSWKHESNVLKGKLRQIKIVEFKQKLILTWQHLILQIERRPKELYKMKNFYRQKGALKSKLF